MADARKIIIVQYLRGIAALAVAWFHLTNSYGAGGIGPLGFYGWLGVDVFFVISGFVIPYSLWNSEMPYRIQGFGKFFLRRLVRLEPPYLVSIAIVIVLGYASAAAPGFRGAYPSQDSYQVLSHFFYLIPFTRYEWLQPVYWSLAYEFAFYIAVGLTYPILAESRHNGIWLLYATSLGIGVVLHLIPELFLLFVIGVSLFRNFAGVERGRVSVAVATIAAAVLALSSTPGSPYVALVGLLTAAAIKLCKRIELQNRLGQGLLFLGMISYSLYLTHVPVGGRVVNLGKRLIEGGVWEFLLSIVALAISILCAWIFYRLVERPSLQLSRQLFTKLRSSEVPAQ